MLHGFMLCKTCLINNYSDIRTLPNCYACQPNQYINYLLILHTNWPSGSRNNPSSIRLSWRQFEGNSNATKHWRRVE